MANLPIPNCWYKLENTPRIKIIGVTKKYTAKSPIPNISLINQLFGNPTPKTFI